MVFFLVFSGFPEKIWTFYFSAVEPLTRAESSPITFFFSISFLIQIFFNFFLFLFYSGSGYMQLRFSFYFSFVFFFFSFN